MIFYINVQGLRQAQVPGSSMCDWLSDLRLCMEATYTGKGRGDLRKPRAGVELKCFSMLMLWKFEHKGLQGNHWLVTFQESWKDVFIASETWLWSAVWPIVLQTGYPESNQHPDKPSLWGWCIKFQFPREGPWPQQPEHIQLYDRTALSQKKASLDS